MTTSATAERTVPMGNQRLTTLQKDVARRVVAAWFAGEQYYRAQTSGERVTLASLYAGGILARRAWRGREGDPSAAYEYRPSDEVLAELRGPAASRG